jgi:predicted transcriptional regulator
LKYIGTKIDADIHHAFSVIATNKGLTKAFILRQAVKKFIEENKGEKSQ